ncbi:hypothetical protein [Staphylococcus haemolyticus]|uniref:hypothetical protein n=1 Tax=Staphylococcus haemolyticus TaxID=1283 RepID=UPI0034D46395
MFEIEHMNETFDYSLVDNETAEFLKEREYTINGIAEDARIKIGRELKKAQDKLANHDKGIFYKWFESGGLNKNQVYYYINLVELSTNLDNLQKDNFLNAPKSLQKEVMKKNAPDDLKQKVLDGDITTHKEYKQLQKDKEELEQQNAQLQSQVEQAQRSEEIAKKQLEDAESREPEVIEKYMEPEDYQSIKNMNEHLESEREYYKKLADDFRNEVKGMMDQPSNVATFTKEEDDEDYTPILLKILEPSEVFIQNYKYHINEQEVINKLEKIIKKLKEQ